jgi:hypothetical protein
MPARFSVGARHARELSVRMERNIASMARSYGGGRLPNISPKKSPSFQEGLASAFPVM